MYTVSKHLFPVAALTLILISVIYSCLVLITVSSLYSFDFYVAFMWTEQVSCIYHGRTKGEGCGHVKSI